MLDFLLFTKLKQSNSQLNSFKKRYQIKQYKQSNKAALTDITGFKEKITQIKEVVNIYKSVNIYNYDKTSLFQLQTPNNTLVTKA